MQGSTRIDELRQKFHENPRRYFAPLANEYRKAGDPEQAIAICRAHLAQQPGHMSGHVVYGQALFDANRKDEARAVFEKALALDPDNAIVLKHLGDISREKGENAEARHWYSRAIDIDPGDREVAAYIAELTEPDTEVPAAPAPEPEPVPEPERETPVAIEREPEVAAPTPEPVESVAEPAIAPIETESEPAPAEDDVAWRKTPPHEDSPFVTRTMAELYASQGYREAALEVYRQLALHHPNDKEIFDRIEALEKNDKTESASAEPVQAERVAAEDVSEEPASVESASVESGPREPVAEATETVEAAEPEADRSPEPIPFEPMISDLPVESTDMELDDTVAFAPTDEDMNLTLRDATHFTETELGTSGDAFDSDSWGAGFSSDEDLNLDFDSPDIPSASVEAQSEAPSSSEPARPQAQEAPEASEQPQESPPPQATAESAAETAMPQVDLSNEEISVEAEPDIPVIDEPAVDIIAAQGEVAPEPAAEYPPEPAPEDEAEETHAEEDPFFEQLQGHAEYEPEPEEASFVAYSPQLPENEDLPHYAPKHPTVREFFATLGAFRPAQAGSAITAHAGIPEPAAVEQAEEYPLANDAFANLFGDAPVDEEDNRAAFALSGALGASTPPSNVAVSAPSEPQPAPEATASTPAQESEEDIRRFREWLDGLAES